jgi:hypothetical protein
LKVSWCSSFTASSKLAATGKELKAFSYRGYKLLLAQVEQQLGKN